MSAFEKFEQLENTPREKRSPLEQCIIDAARLEDMRDGDYTQMEVAIWELEYLRAKRLEGISAYDIANAAVDEIFMAGDGTKIDRIALVDRDDKDHGGWGKNPARDVILKHIRAALTRA